MARSTQGEASGRWRAEPTHAVIEDGRVMVIEVARWRCRIRVSMARSTRGEASGRWRAEPTRAVIEDGRVMVIEVA
uniref:Uncharacterized protein n=1 Tax=Oryza rufipogon TaxID=4529 RepID=A0A0E0R837_ORYRU